MEKLKTFWGKNHFEKDATQNYLVFKPMHRYFKMVNGVGIGNFIYLWKSKGLPDEIITPPNTSDYSLSPQVGYLGTKTRLEFKGSCLKQDIITYDHGKVLQICIVYEISKTFNISSYPTLENCLFRAEILTKNADIDKHKYYGYEIGFNRPGFFHTLEAELLAEKLYSINFTENNKNVVWTCIIMQIAVSLLLVQKFMNLKQRILRL